MSGLQLSASIPASLNREQSSHFPSLLQPYPPQPPLYSSVPFRRCHLVGTACVAFPKLSIIPSGGGAPNSVWAPRHIHLRPKTTWVYFASSIQHFAEKPYSAQSSLPSRIFPLRSAICQVSQRSLSFTFESCTVSWITTIHSSGFSRLSTSVGFNSAKSSFASMLQRGSFRADFFPTLPHPTESQLTRLKTRVKPFDDLTAKVINGCLPCHLCPLAGIGSRSREVHSLYHMTPAHPMPSVQACSSISVTTIFCNYIPVCCQSPHVDCSRASGRDILKRQLGSLMTQSASSFSSVVMFECYAGFAHVASPNPPPKRPCSTAMIQSAISSSKRSFDMSWSSVAYLSM